MAAAPTCPRCGRENDPSFAFCHDCGQALRVDPDRTCTRCGSKLPASFRFCGHCGHPAEPPSPRRPTSPSSGGKDAPGTAPSPVSPSGAPVRLVLVRHDGLPGASHLLDREVTICGRRDGDLLLPEDG